MIPVVYVFAYFLAALAVALLAPVLIAAGTGEGRLIPDLLITAALIVFVAGALMLSLRGRERRLQPGQRYLLCVMLWVLLPLFGAFPLLISIEGLSFPDAYFQTVSALTTTGASVLPPPDQLPRTIVFWLAMTQWLGGALTLLVIVLVLAPGGVGGLPEAHARMVEHGGLPEKRRLVLMLRDLMPLYIGATALCFILLGLSGVPAFDALCLAFAGTSTGGFAPRSAELTEYVPSTGILLLTLFMLYGATSVLWHRDVLRGRWQQVREHREGPWIAAVCGVLGVIGAAGYFAAGSGVALALRDGLFTATSLVTTTGLEVRPGSFAVWPVTLVVLLVFIGGGSFSTAGGIKCLRIGAMLVQSGRELHRLVYPHGIRPARYGSQSYDMQIMKAIWAGFLAFFGMGIVVSWMVALDGVPYDGALLAAASALANAGPVYASDWADGGDWLAYGDMSAPTRLVLCAAMVLGRLEVIAALSLIVYVQRQG